MKIYLFLKENNVITGFSYDPIEGTTEFDIENPFSIQFGIDTLEDGNVVKGAIPQEQQNKLRIMELKKLLRDSDYICLKHADGELTDEEYAEIKAQRHAWRTEINELEG